MRSAGCVINDFADRRVDGHVRRTARRPLPGRPAQCAPGAGVLCLAGGRRLCAGTHLNRFTILLSVAGLGLAVVYPFMKRVTHLPQLVLGLAFSWAIPTHRPAHPAKMIAARAPNDSGSGTFPMARNKEHDGEPCLRALHHAPPRIADSKVVWQSEPEADVMTLLDESAAVALSEPSARVDPKRVSERRRLDQPECMEFEATQEAAHSPPSRRRAEGRRRCR